VTRPLVLAGDLLVDRYYRGAIVMVGATTYALPEEVVVLLEKVQRSAGPFVAADGDEQALADLLLARGILVGVAE